MTVAPLTSPYTPSRSLGESHARARPEQGDQLDGERREAIGTALLAWYRRVQRRLPWRASRDPYCIWVSEVMLQQTQVATVIDFYERWMRRFPDVAALAGANEEDVLRAWEGLGYYSRARNLWHAARQLVETRAGQLPPSAAELRQLPGIGAYSAGAIASIAFGADEPAVDGNIIRVLTRLFAIGGDPKTRAVSERLWQLARALIPQGQARDFNQALMELGATCCTPKAPKCPTCPLAARCTAQKLDRVLDFPEVRARPKPTLERRAVAVIRRRGRLLVVQQPSDAIRWAGMWQFPEAPCTDPAAERATLTERVAKSTGLHIEVADSILALEHQVTRFRISLEVFACTPLRGRARALECADVRWCDLAALASLPMPAAHRKIARSLA